ncbi:MAG: acyclic terpene utilization AtuA family protein [Betaproteobacteria bacterium]
MKPRLRIGAGASYAGDRIEPATDLAARGQLDYLVYECLAERTIALAQLDRLKDPDKGYNELLDERFRQALPHCHAHGTRVITSMGAANPIGAARHTARIIDELGLAPMKTAAVVGDDVLDYCIAHRDTLQCLETGAAIGALAGDMVSANAYLGAEPIVEALKMGADVVLTGRVADCSLFLAPMILEFGWRSDDWVRLGRGQAAGDMVECGAIVSGGYFADPGYKEVADLARLGFPYLIVEPDGTAEVTKLEGTGGLISRATCTEQLLYEVHDLANYITPDVIVDFSDVALDEVGADRVRISGVAGKPRPRDLKVSIGVREGWIGEGEITYAGPGCLERARLAERVVRERIGIAGITLQELRVDYIGLNSLHGEASIAPAAPSYEVRLRFAGRAAARRDATRLASEVETLVGKGPCSSSLPRQYVREVLAIYSCLIPREATQPRVMLVESSR